jgi:molecular chaperone GrpE
MTSQDADESETDSPDAVTDSETGQSHAGTEATTSDDETATGDHSEDTDDAVEELLSEVAQAPDKGVDDALEEIAEDEDHTETTPDPDSEEVPTFETQVDPAQVSVTDDFRSTVAALETDQVARALAVMHSEIERLNEELDDTRERADDLESRLARKQADFENYKKRQKERLEDEKQRATEDLVERLLDVRDNLARALEQDEDADIRGGVKSTLEQFDQQLDRENVEQITPDVGDDTDPRRHEVLATIASDQPEGTIAQIHRTGYVMGDKVLRPAQVAVSDGSLDEE